MPLRSLLLGSLVFSVTALAKVPDTRLEATAQQFFRFPDFHSLEVNREGSAFAMIKRVGDRELLTTFDLKKGEGLKQESTRSLSVFSFGWIDNEHLIAGYAQWDHYFSGLFFMDEQFRGFRELGVSPEDPNRRLHAGDSVRIGRDERRVLTPAAFLPFVDDIAIIRNRSSRPYSQLLRYDRRRQSLNAISSPDEDLIDWAFDLKGQFRLRQVRSEASNTAITYHRASDDAEWEVVNLPDDWHHHGFDISGRVIYLTFPENGKRILRGYDLIGGEFTRGKIEDPVYGITDPKLIRDTQSGALLGISYQADKPVTRYFDRDLTNFMELMERSFPDQAHRFVGPDIRGGYIIESWGDRYPYRLSRFDPEAGSLELLGQQFLGFSPDALSRMHPFTFENREGETIRGYYSLPAAEGERPEQPLPTVVLVHGGPRARDYWEFNPEVQFYTALGYAVLQVNYRGSSMLYSPETRSLLDACREGPADVIDATRWAIAEGIADPSRIAIAGWSFGGYIALAAAAEEPELFQCAVGAAGVYDFDRQIIEMMRDPYRRELIEWDSIYFGDLESRAEDFAKVSPINRADKIKIPVYLLHGGADRTVYRSQSVRMESALRAAQVAVEIDTPTWLGHGALTEEHNIRFSQRIFRFIETHLGSARK